MMEIEHLRRQLLNSQDRHGQPIFDPRDVHQLLSIRGTLMENEHRIQQARNLLACVHADGGHHTTAVGFEASCLDAKDKYYAMVRKIDILTLALRKIRDRGFAEDNWVWTIAYDALNEAACTQGSRTKHDQGTGRSAVVEGGEGQTVQEHQYDCHCPACCQEGL